MSNSTNIFNRKVPTRLAYLLIIFAATFAAFIIVKTVAGLPTTHVSPIFTPRFGTPVK